MDNYFSAKDYIISFIKFVSSYMDRSEHDLNPGRQHLDR